MTQEEASHSAGEGEAAPGPFWADEMLGRLARYLRLLGLDTAYATGLSDEEVARRARAEGRILLTRDRALAGRVPGSVLLTRLDLRGQWSELKERLPGLPDQPHFDRCTLCNGRLAPAERDVRGRPTFVCAVCGHRYWEGTHTESVRATLARWAEEPAR
jgi:uncharacterized protein